MLKYILMLLACWFVLSVPISLAVGRFIHVGLRRTDYGENNDE